MTDMGNFLSIAGQGLAVSAALAVVVWAASVPLKDVSIVDSAWSLLVVSPGLVAAWHVGLANPRGTVALAIALLWALRLAGHITWRHRGEPEDRRYQEIRARNQPHFQWKSLYLVFGLQAVLGWIVSLPLIATALRPAPWAVLDGVGIAVALFGLLFEATADAQLTRFKSDPANKGKVMDRGLWRYSRHPNYFGEFCLWWGLWLLALSAGAWWTLLSPLLMSVLLLKVSGVTLLEKDIGERRPAYRDYIARTPTFFPWKPSR